MRLLPPCSRSRVLAEPRGPVTEHPRPFLTELPCRGAEEVTRLAAIDPGLRGAVSVTTGPYDKEAAVCDLPVMGAGKQVILDGGTIARLLTDMAVDRVVLEHVSSMPKQGVASTFKFGTTFGQLIGVVQTLGIVHEFVRPNVWMRDTALPSGPDKKEAARRRAIESFPHLGPRLSRKCDHNRAEALLLGLWWWDHRGN